LEAEIQKQILQEFSTQEDLKNDQFGASSDFDKDITDSQDAENE